MEVWHFRVARLKRRIGREAVNSAEKNISVCFSEETIIEFQIIIRAEIYSSDQKEQTARGKCSQSRMRTRVENRPIKIRAQSKNRVKNQYLHNGMQTRRLLGAENCVCRDSIECVPAGAQKKNTSAVKQASKTASLADDSRLIRPSRLPIILNLFPKMEKADLFLKKNAEKENFNQYWYRCEFELHHDFELF
jgi:hypothetical protein